MQQYYFNQNLIILCFRFLILLTILLIITGLIRFFITRHQEIKIISPKTNNSINVPQMLHEKYLKRKQLYDQWLEDAKRLQYWSQQISNENRIFKNRRALAIIVRKISNEQAKQIAIQQKKENSLEIKRLKSKINKTVVQNQKLADNKSSFKSRRRK